MGSIEVVGDHDVSRDDDDDVYYYIRWRLKLEGETVFIDRIWTIRDGFITFQFQIYTKNQKTKGTCREHHGEVEALRRGGAGRGQAGAQARRCSCDR